MNGGMLPAVVQDFARGVGNFGRRFTEKVDRVLRREIVSDIGFLSDVILGATLEHILPRFLNIAGQLDSEHGEPDREQGGSPAGMRNEGQRDALEH